VTVTLVTLIRQSSWRNLGVSELAGACMGHDVGYNSQNRPVNSWIGEGCGVGLERLFACNPTLFGGGDWSWPSKNSDC
jgi:hypothetical protein